MDTWTKVASEVKAMASFNVLGTLEKGQVRGFKSYVQESLLEINLAEEIRTEELRDAQLKD